MDRRLSLLLALPWLTLAGFAPPSIEPSAANIALGELAYADGPLIQPVRVLEDSRCPVDVRCAWAGTVRVKMRWRRPTGRIEDFEVRLGDRTPLADGSVMLMAVRPERHSSRPIERRDYRFDFRFDGGL